MSTKPQASFRGAAFYIENDSGKAGRRQQTYSLPFQDKGVIATDTGRAPKKFRINGLLHENPAAGALLAQYDALIEAFETEGPGTLVHPIYGRVLVYAEPVEWDLRQDAQGIIRVKIEVEEAAQNQNAGPRIDTGAVLQASASKGQTAVAASFANPETGLKSPISDFVKEANLDVLGEVLSDMRKVNGAVSAVLAIPSGIAAQIDAIATQAEDLINTPEALFASLQGALVTISNSVTRVIGEADEEVLVTAVEAATLPLNRTRGSRGSMMAAIGQMALLGSAAPEVPEVDTPERRDQRQGQDALQRHTRGAGLLGLADAVLDSRFDSQKDAIAVRDKLANALIDLADSEPDLDVDMADALRDAAASVISHLTRIAGTAAQVTRYAHPETLPIEVLAYVLYGDSERADEILLRNPQIADPSFVQGKADLELATE